MSVSFLNKAAGLANNFILKMCLYMNFCKSFKGTDFVEFLWVIVSDAPY